MPEQQPEFDTYYRCLMTKPATPWDFTSSGARGMPLRAPETVARKRQWWGLSIYRDLERARWRCDHMNPRHPWVAVLEIPRAGPITVEKTSVDPVHYTAYGTPHAFTDCVVSVVAASPEEGDQGE